MVFQNPSEIIVEKMEEVNAEINEIDMRIAELHKSKENLIETRNEYIKVIQLINKDQGNN